MAERTEVIYREEIRELIIRRSRFCLLLAMLLNLAYLALEASFFSDHLRIYLLAKVALTIILALSIPFTFREAFRKRPYFFAASLFLLHLIVDSGVFYLSGCHPSYVSSFILSMLFVTVLFPYHQVLSLVMASAILLCFNGTLLLATKTSWVRPTGEITSVYFLNQNFLLIAIAFMVFLKSFIENRLKYSEFLSRKRLEQSLKELREAQGGLIHAEKMVSLGRFVAGIAHELNNPLNFVYGNLKPLERHIAQLESAPQAPENAGVFADLRRIMASLREGTVRMRDLIRNLRVFSHAGQAAERGATPAKEPLDVRQLLEKSILFLQHVGHRQVTVEREYHTVPPFLGDAGHLEQVFLNILTNAIDALPAGKGTIFVTIAPLHDSTGRVTTITVSIRDNGCGIAAPVLPHIFEPFFTTKEVGKGTGLGLSICHTLVKSLGGEIAVESCLGVGSVFTLSLPLIEPETAKVSSEEVAA